MNIPKPAPIGHNLAVEKLRSIVQRIEKLDKDKAAIVADIRDIMAEAKGNGFDPKAIREILKQRRLDAAEREEQQSIIDMYKRALGMIPQLEDEERI